MIKKGIGIWLVVGAISFFSNVVLECAFGSDDQYLPPIVGGRHDFEGVRFIDRDTKGIFTSYRSSVLKRGYRLILEPNPVALNSLGYPPTGKRKLILVKDIHEGDTNPREARVHRLKEIKTLADLKGFVKIKSKHDALEFLRFGSSMMDYQYFKPTIEEVFCVDQISASSALLVTRPDCLLFGFTPPEIEIRDKKPSEHSEDKDDDERAVGEDDDDPKGKWFIIRRTVYSAPPPKKGFLRITEEVGPSGQWRIVSEQLISQRNFMNERIFDRR